MANIIEILFRARDAQETAQSAREVAQELRDLNEAGQQGAEGLNSLTASMQQTQAAAQQGIQTPQVDPGNPPVVEIPPDARRQIQELQTDLDRLRNGAERTRESTAALGQSFQAIGSAAGVDSQVLSLVRMAGAAAAAGAAIGITVRELRASVGAAAEAETAQRRLENALGAVGALSTDNVRDLQEYAAQIQRTTAFSDELVISTAALVAQIAQVSGEKLKELTTAILDVSAALGRDPQSVALQVARGEVGRLGITLDETIPKAQRLDAALQQIQQKFGGSAAAEVNTYAGAVAQSKNALDELRESIGSRMLPVLTQLAQQAKGAFETLANAAGGGQAQQSLSELVAEFERVSSQLSTAANPELERLQRNLALIEEEAVKQITFNVSHGGLSSVLGQLSRIDEILKQSTDSGSQVFQQFVERLRSAASQGVDFKLRISTEEAEANALKAIERIRGEAEIDVLLRGTTDFNAAVEDLRGLKEEASTPIEQQLTVDLSNLEKQRADLEAKLKSAVDLGRLDPFASQQPGRAGIDTAAIVEQIAAVDRQIAELRARIVATIDETLAKLRETTRQEAIISLRTRIDGADSIDEVADTLRQVQDETIAARDAWQQASEDPALRQIALGLADAEQVARTLARTRIRELVDRAAIEQLIELNRQIREAAAGAGADLRLISDEELRKVGSVTEASKLLLASLKDLQATGTPEQLAAFYNRMTEIIAENTEKVRANREELGALAIEAQKLRDTAVGPAVQLEQQRREVSELIALVRQLQDTAGTTTTARIIDTQQLGDFDTLAAGLESATAATEALTRAQAELLASGDPEKLGNAYESLDATLKRAAAGQSNLTAAQVEHVRILAAEVEKTVQTLEPLERAQFVAAQARVDIDERQFAEAKEKLEQLKAAHGAIPEDKRIRVVVEVLQEDIRDAEEEARERGSGIGRALSEGLGDTSREALEAVGQGATTAFIGMEQDAARAFDSIGNLAKNMVNRILAELARLAAASLFKALLSVITAPASIGGALAGFGLGGQGKAGTPGEPEPVDLPAPDVNVPPIEPIDLPGIVLQPPAYTVGAFEDVTLAAPDVRVPALAGLVLEPPDVTVEQFAAVSMDAPAINLGQPDLAIAPLDAIELDAPAIRLGQAPALTLAPRVTLGALKPITVVPDLEVGPFTTPGLPAHRLGEAPPPVERRDDLLRTSTAEFARNIATQTRETTLLRRILSLQPLSRNDEIATAFTPTGTSAGKTVIIEEGAVKAIDAASFGDYMTVGPGASAMADAALEGR